MTYDQRKVRSPSTGGQTRSGAGQAAPHKPLDPGSAAPYVAPPFGGAQEIAALVMAGSPAVLLGGPVGIGKSSELAEAAFRLQGERVACLVRLDRWENMRRLDPDRLAPAPAEVSPLAPQKRIAFLIDGLEKAGAQNASVLLEELAGLPDSVDVVVGGPRHTIFGARPNAILRTPHCAAELLVKWRPNSILREGERLVEMRAVDVEGESGAVGLTFLTRVLTRRLGLNLEDLAGYLTLGDAKRMVVMDAARWGGGVPSTFLRLLAFAGTHARARPRAG